MQFIHHIKLWIIWITNPWLCFVHIVFSASLCITNMAQTIRFGFCWLGSSVQYYYSYYSNHWFLLKYLLHPASVHQARDKIIIKIWRKTCFVDSILSWIKSNHEIVEDNTNCWSCDSNWEIDSTFSSCKGSNRNEMNNYLYVCVLKHWKEYLDEYVLIW